jgi:hypothetical protein
MNDSHDPASPARRNLPARTGAPLELFVERSLLDLQVIAAQGAAPLRPECIVAVDTRSGCLVAHQTDAGTDRGGALARFITHAVAQATSAAGAADGTAAGPVRVVLDFGYESMSRAVHESCASLGVDLVFRRHRVEAKGAAERAFLCPARALPTRDAPGGTDESVE